MKASRTASSRRTGQCSTLSRSGNPSKLDLLLPASVVYSMPRTCAPPASWLWHVSGRGASSATGEPMIESATRRQRALVGRKSASQRSGMSETCPNPLPASWEGLELEAATRQGEPSGRLPRTVDDCVATASVAPASKLAKAASAQDRPRFPASWKASSASMTACPSSEGLRNTHPAIRHSTPRLPAVEQVVSYELLGFTPRRQAAAESSHE